MADGYRVEKWTERNAPNGAMLRLLMERGGYRVFQWSDQPGAFRGTHKRAEAQSHWVISGSMEITVQSRAYLLEAGDRGFMPPGTYYSARVIGEEPVVYLVGELGAARPAEPLVEETAEPLVADDGRFPSEVLEFFSSVGVSEDELMRPAEKDGPEAFADDDGEAAGEGEEAATSEREG
jgi:mannose-6-phosphate isomerase-like protein (cupin superfamily)